LEFSVRPTARIPCGRVVGRVACVAETTFSILETRGDILAPASRRIGILDTLLATMNLSPSGRVVNRDRSHDWLVKIAVFVGSLRAMNRPELADFETVWTLARVRAEPSSAQLLNRSWLGSSGLEQIESPRRRARRRQGVDREAFTSGQNVRWETPRVRLCLISCAACSLRRGGANVPERQLS
jgi:hypothetical protein